MAMHSIYSITTLLFYTHILFHKKQSVCNSLLCRGWQEISKVLMQHFSKTWWLTHQDSASSMLLQSSVRTLTFYPKGKWIELSIELDNKKAITYSEFWYFSPRFLRLMLQSTTEKKSTRGYLPAIIYTSWDVTTYLTSASFKEVLHLAITNNSFEIQPPLRG